MQAVKILQSLAALPEGAHTAVRVHALEMLRVLGVNGQISGALIGIVVKEMLPPQGHLVKNGVVGPEEFFPGQVIVVPVHHYLPAACIVGRRGAQAGKKGALHRAGDDQGLALLHMEAHLNEELGIFLQFFLHRIHCEHFLYFKISIKSSAAMDLVTTTT